MTRHIFDWHPELNLFASNLRNKVDILLPDGEGNHFPPPQDKVGFIDADEVADYYFDNQENTDLTTICVKAPWKVTWIEYTLPGLDAILEDIKEVLGVSIPGGLQLGSYVLVYDVHEEERTRCLALDMGLDLVAAADNTIDASVSVPFWKEWNKEYGRERTMKMLSQKYECHTIQVFQVYMADRKHWNHVGYIVLYLDEDGRAIENAGAELVDPESVEVVSIITKPMLMTLGLLNCRNVETKPCGSSKTQVKKFKRYGSPVISRRTLVIKPAGARSEPTGNKSGEKMPWHMCRGHFKTFTDASPLFGRITGTFWWNAQVRGKKSVGEVHKDYRIEPE